jgi:hypothetical protein
VSLSGRQPLDHLPRIMIDRAGAADAIVSLLEHIARYLSVERLMNYDPRSPLREALAVGLARLPAGFDPADPVREHDRAPLAPDQLIQTGDWLCLSLRSRWTRPLSIVVLDLQPGWSIEQVVPASRGLDVMTLDPGVEELVPLQACLPAGIDEGQDLIKVLGTIDPVSFRWLELPRPEEPRVRGVGHRVPLDELEAILDRSGAGVSRARDGRSVSRVSWQWVVEQRRVRVTRRPRGSARSAGS